LGNYLHGLVEIFKIVTGVYTYMVLSGFLPEYFCYAWGIWLPFEVDLYRFQYLSDHFGGILCLESNLNPALLCLLLRDGHSMMQPFFFWLESKVEDEMQRKHGV
jgi:hypothetical protein